MTAPARKGPWAAIFAACVLAAGAASIALGKDANWDLRNYHWYNLWALMNGRLGWDLAPAQIQTYYNPVGDLPFYFLVQWLPWPRARRVGVDRGRVPGRLRGRAQAHVRDLRRGPHRRARDLGAVAGPMGPRRARLGTRAGGIPGVRRLLGVGAVEFGNPLFPYYNHVFHSPWWEPVAFFDRNNELRPTN